MNSKTQCIIQSLRWSFDHQLRQTNSETDKKLLIRALRIIVQLSLPEYSGSEQAYRKNLKDPSLLKQAINELSQLAQLLKDTALESESKSLGIQLNNSLNEQHAVFVEHQQGICHSGECHQALTPPCQQACPSHINIPGFLAQIGQHNFTGATDTIRQSNPLPYSCGLVCPAPCEDHCQRKIMDESVNIKSMKAYTAQKTLDSETCYPLPSKKVVATEATHKVAIIGSGPAGLSAAYYLALLGHQVVVFDAKHEVGGMLRYGIPDYRLPMDILSQEINEIKRLGVKLITQHPITDLNTLTNEYDAVFLSIGTQTSRAIPLEGSKLPFVLGGIEFLHQISQGNPMEIGHKIVVVGGGNVAIDVALTALRTGGTDVHLFCLESREQMPASDNEIAQAVAEGVIIHNSWGPQLIEQGKDSAQHTIHFSRCLSLFNDDGQFAPEFDHDTHHNQVVDNVILAVGQTTKFMCARNETDIKINRDLICADPDTLHTDMEGVFAGGDAFHGPRTVVEAIQTGKQAAFSIDAFLSGKEFIWDDYYSIANYFPAIHAREAHIPRQVARTDRATRALSSRSDIPEISIDKRVNNFSRIDLGLSDEMADNESTRCLRCDVCIGCGLCELACMDIGVNALHFKPTKDKRLIIADLMNIEEKCIACGACTQVCPTGAISLSEAFSPSEAISHSNENNETTRYRSLIFTGTIISRIPLLECQQCHSPLYSGKYSERINAMVKNYDPEDKEQHLCSHCKREREARLMGIRSKVIE